jgi:CBS domain containing-hemolysin-like protein
MSEYLIPIGIILALVTVNGLFVAAEFALVGSRRSRLQTLADGGNGIAKRLLGIFDHPRGKDSYIAIAQLGITLASIGLGMFGEPAVAAWLYPTLETWGLTYDQSHALGFVIALNAITFLHVVFGEMIPKALALQVPEQVSIRVNPLMRLFGFLFKPMVLALNWIAFALMKLLGIPDPGKSASLYSSKELAIATEEVAASGQLDHSQRILIDNIFEMEDRTAEELMTSRTRLTALPIDMNPQAVAGVITGSRQARYPIFDGSLDEIVGVLHVKDFIRGFDDQTLHSLKQVTRPLARVAASTSASELLALFKKQRVHAALVVDEYGGTLGFVTMDEIIEDLIDEEEGGASDWIKRLPDGGMLLDGEVTLAELSEDFDVTIKEPEVTTVAGLFLIAEGLLPEQGATLEREGWHLRVEEMDGLKITRVRMSPQV